MASNYYCGGSGGQYGNLLTYPMKNLSIGPTQAPIALDALPGTTNAAGFGHPLNVTRAPLGPNVDGSLSSLFRPPSSRSSGFNDGLVSQISVSTGAAVRQNIPGVTVAEQGSSVPVFSSHNGFFKVNDRSRTPVKPSDFDNQVFGLQSTVPAYSASRVLSNLQDSSPLSFNSSISSNICSPFITSRFRDGTRDNYQADDTIVPINDIRQDLAHLPSSTNSLNNVLSIPPSYAQILPSPIKPTPQLPFPTSSVVNSNLARPLVENSTDTSLESNLGVNASSRATQYYTNQQFNSARDLQASGALKAANWILIPPVPEGIAAHMRTGRVHELRSRACSDRVFNASYMDHELKQVLHNKAQACLFTGDESIREKLPRNLGAYTDLVPLEVMHQPRVSVTFGLPSVCFKAWSPRFSRPMLLRRVILPVEHAAALPPDAFHLAKQLSELDHPAVVGFRDIFFTNAFDDNSAIVVYEFTPCCATLQQTHMSDPMKLTSFSSPFNISRTVRPHSALKSGPSDFGMLPEATLWSYIVQLVHGLRFIHQQIRRPCGVLDPTKVLIQDGTRLRINCFGLKDILFYQPQDSNLDEDQAEDFVQLGKLLLGVSCGTAEAIQTSQRVTSFNLLQRTYKPELVSLMRSLISGQITSVDQLMRATAPYMYDHLTSLSDHSDFLERQLFLGMECDRLFRMVCKLQSIVERNDRNAANPDWSETGDRYMLKLFRDFLFHQTDHLGAPYLDLSHVITVLNKVEAASTERLCLVSRDSQNIILTNYADVKQWLDSSFAYLVEKHRQSRCEIQMAHQRDIRSQQQSTNGDALGAVTKPQQNI